MLLSEVALTLLLASSPGVTTGTLRLADLFDAPPPQGETWRAAELRPDPAGAVLAIPDLSAWRLPPPTPTPTPAPVGELPPVLEEIPRLSVLPNPERSLFASIAEPAFEFRGVDITRSHPGEAEVTIETPFTQLRVEYRLVAAQEGHQPLIFFHGPRSGETFRLPAGRWHLEWRAWRREEPLAVVERRHAPQDLVATGRYRFTAPGEEEASLMAELRAIAGRRR